LPSSPWPVDEGGFDTSNEPPELVVLVELVVAVVVVVEVVVDIEDVEDVCVVVWVVDVLVLESPVAEAVDALVPS